MKRTFALLTVGMLGLSAVSLAAAEEMSPVLPCPAFTGLRKIQCLRRMKGTAQERSRALRRQDAAAHTRMESCKEYTGLEKARCLRDALREERTPSGATRARMQRLRTYRIPSTSDTVERCQGLSGRRQGECLRALGIQRMNRGFRVPVRSSSSSSASSSAVQSSSSSS